VHQLCISIDGATKETYESIRIGGKFDKLMSNIKALNAAKEDLSSRLPKIWFNITLMRSNIRELPHLVKLAHTLQVAGLLEFVWSQQRVRQLTARNHSITIRTCIIAC
jgi:MoaA/NifB/PqqE/SkfB family radical SAM enzyme